MSSRYLYVMIHGRKPLRATTTRKAWQHRGPARSSKYKAWVRSLPCAVCDTTRDVEAAHAGSDGGTAQKASDYSCIPLCPHCHTVGPDSYHRLGRSEFERRHGLCCRCIVRDLTRTWFKYAELVK